MVITIGFSIPKSETILSKLIRWIEKRPFSHVFVKFPEPGLNQEVIFQASGLFVNIMLESAFIQQCNIVEEFSIEVNDDAKLDVWYFILNQLSVKYSIKQLFAILIKKIFHYEPKFGDDNSGEICSELAARLLIYLGYKIPGNLNYITPSDLEKYCAENLKNA